MMWDRKQVWRVVPVNSGTQTLKYVNQITAKVQLQLIAQNEVRLLSATTACGYTDDHSDFSKDTNNLAWVYPMKNRIIS